METLTETLPYLSPNLDDFEGIYHSEQISKDKNRVIEAKKRANYDAGMAEKHSTFSGVENAANAMRMEIAVSELITADDLFSEWEMTDGSDILEDENSSAIRVIHGSEYDDWCNHADLVCVAKNSLTNNDPIPFILDVTYNATESKIYEKFSWTHPKYQEIPGFSTIKYYQDLDASDEDDQILPTGQIKILPRFVVGFSPDLLDSNDPETENKRKICVLSELNTQCDGLLKMLSDKKNGSSDLETMHENLQKLSRYFKRAEEIFEKKLTETSEDLSKMPASPYFDQPKAYKEKVMRYPYSNTEEVYPLLTLTTENKYH